LFDFPSPRTFRQSFFCSPPALPTAEQILSVDFLAPIVVRFSFIVSRAAGFLYATTRGGGTDVPRDTRVSRPRASSAPNGFAVVLATFVCLLSLLLVMMDDPLPCPIALLSRCLLLIVYGTMYSARRSARALGLK
jgi:hypothetical protein